MTRTEPATTSWFKRFALPGLAFKAVVITGGYRLLALLILAVYVVPLATIGIWRLTRRPLLIPEAA